MKTKKLTLILILISSIVLNLNLTKADENIYLKIDNLVKTNREKAENFYKALWQIYNYTQEKLWIDKYDFDYSNLYWFNLEWLKNKWYWNNIEFWRKLQEEYAGIRPYINLDFANSNIRIIKNNNYSTFQKILNNFENIKNWKIDISKNDFLEKWFLYSDSDYTFQHNPIQQKLIKNKKWEIIWISYYTFSTFRNNETPSDFWYYAFFVKNNSILEFSTNDSKIFWFEFDKFVKKQENNINFDYDNFLKEYFSKWYPFNEKMDCALENSNLLKLQSNEIMNIILDNY